MSADRIQAGLATINGNLARQVAKKTITEDDRKKALTHIKPAE
jgi:3-hydroxybutyryl-CoA dehydrogenase